jgi:hypothetical protein
VQAISELKATAQLAVGTFTWTATVALAKFGPGMLWDADQRVLSWGAVVVNVIAGLAWIVTIIRFLRAVDELQRKIMLDALGITLGVGWVAAFAYVVADGAEIVTQDLDVAALSVLMAVVFLAAIGAGNFRYR